MAVDVKGSFKRKVSFAWFLLKKFLNFINPVEWLICFQYPIKGVLSVLGNATLGWYLVGGVVVCGGLGIIFTLFKVNFEWGDKAVLDSIIIFIATIIGGALFDLVFNLIKPEVSNKIPSFVAIEMIVLAMVMLLFAAKLYFMPMLTDVSRDNSKTVST